MLPLFSFSIIIITYLVLFVNYYFLFILFFFSLGSPKEKGDREQWGMNWVGKTMRKRNYPTIMGNHSHVVYHCSLVYTFIIIISLSFVNVQNKQMYYRKVVHVAQGFVVAKVFCKDISLCKLGPCQLTAALRSLFFFGGGGCILGKIFFDL